MPWPQPWPTPPEAHRTTGNTTDEDASMPELHPQFLTDPDGNRLSVVLPMAEYEALMEYLEDMEDIADARQARDEPTIPWETVKAEMGL
jgi:hypothetical protein